MTNDFLKTFTDPHNLSGGALKTWCDEVLALLQGASYTPEVIGSFAPCTLDRMPLGPFGGEASAEWRRFFWGTLLADWACYEKPVDRIDYERLRYIMSSAYPHFRLWTCRMPNGMTLPVGYSGWYPIARFVFDALCGEPDQIDDRGVFLPLRSAVVKPLQHIYVLNASIIAPLRNTVCAGRMVHALRQDLRQHRHANIAAIVVAEEGRRMAALVGLKQAGKVTVHGESEALFVRTAT